MLAAVGLIVSSTSIAAARQPFVGATEARLFHALNGMPDQLYPFLWVPMQLGNLVVGTVVGVAVAVVAGDSVVAVGVAIAAVLKLVTERIVGHQMAAYLTTRASRARPRCSRAPRGALEARSRSARPRGR